jgi:hypothetical protein
MRILLQLLLVGGETNGVAVDPSENRHHVTYLPADE